MHGELSGKAAMSPTQWKKFAQSRQSNAVSSLLRYKSWIRCGAVWRMN